MLDVLSEAHAVEGVQQTRRLPAALAAGTARCQVVSTVVLGIPCQDMKQDNQRMGKEREREGEIERQTEGKRREEERQNKSEEKQSNRTMGSKQGTTG